MAVEQIKAYQIRDGRTFSKKAEACHEEIVCLLNEHRLPLNRTGFGLDVFDEAIKNQRDLVTALFDMRKGLQGESDKKILEELEMFIGITDTWLAEATALRKDIDT